MRYLLVAFTALIGVNIASHAHAQAVQLPTFRYFGVQTTVSVPDRGGAVLGGVNRASSGSTSRGFGPFRSRGFGSSVGASTASVHATIIDHEELDQATLAEARHLRGASEEPLMLRYGRTSPADERIASKADHLSRNVALRDMEAPPMQPTEVVESLADIRARAAARQQAKLSEAAERLAAGIASEEAGKFASARGHYEAAIRLGDDTTRQQASERLAKIALPPTRAQRVAKEH
jgi:hypothetical protein